MSAFEKGGSVNYGPVDVDATARVVVQSRGARKSVIIMNAEAATNIVYLGGDDDVVASTGLPLGPGESVRLDDFHGTVWGIADTADTDVRIFEVF